MRVDAHQHFWIYEPVEYAWMTDDMSVLRRDRLPADLHERLTSRSLDACVAVQARQSLAETRWLLDLASESSFIRGVVGWVDLRAADVEDQLTRVAHPRLRGIRHVVQDEPDDEFLLRDDFARGVDVLAGHGLTYDILIYPRQLPAALRFCERFPAQPLVLDHMAKPDIRSGALEPWAAAIREMAQFDHVYCKMSGLVTEADWKNWRPDDFVPYLDVAYEAFGEDRVMFGSDWPVCELAADYASVHDLLERWASQLSATATEKLFGGNATRFYGLSE